MFHRRGAEGEGGAVATMTDEKGVPPADVTFGLVANQLTHLCLRCSHQLRCQTAKAINPEYVIVISQCINWKQRKPRRGRKA